MCSHNERHLLVETVILRLRKGCGGVGGILECRGFGIPTRDPRPCPENRLRNWRRNHGMSHGNHAWEFLLTTIFIQCVLLVSLRTTDQALVPLLNDVWRQLGLLVFFVSSSWCGPSRLLATILRLVDRLGQSWASSWTTGFAAMATISGCPPTGNELGRR